MRKRVGALTALPLVVGMVASMTLGGTVAAKPWTGVTLTRTSACHYTVWYSWTGMGHGNDLKAIIRLSLVDAGGSSTYETFSAENKSGSDGVLNHDFVVTGQQYPFQFQGSGELSIPSKSQVIAKSVSYSSPLKPQTPELCS